MDINILLVGKDHTRKLLKKYLEIENYTIIGECSNYVDASRLYKGLGPDVVIVDLDIDFNLSGIDFCKSTTKLDSTAKIITLSNKFESQYKSELEKNGINNFVYKPIQPVFIYDQLDDIKSNTNFSKSRKERSHILSNISLENDADEINSVNELNNQVLKLKEQLSIRKTEKNKNEAEVEISYDDIYNDDYEYFEVDDYRSDLNNLDFNDYSDEDDVYFEIDNYSSNYDIYNDDYHNLSLDFDDDSYDDDYDNLSLDLDDDSYDDYHNLSLDLNDDSYDDYHNLSLDLNDDSYDDDYHNLSLDFDSNSNKNYNYNNLYSNLSDDKEKSSYLNLPKFINRNNSEYDEAFIEKEVLKEDVNNLNTSKRKSILKKIKNEK